MPPHNCSEKHNGHSRHTPVYTYLASFYPGLTWSEFRPDIHQAFINGHYRKYEYSAIRVWDINIHYSYDTIGITKLFWHRAKVYFICIKPLWWLTQHEHNPRIHFRYITTNIQHLWYNGHKCYILAQSQSIFYMHQVPIVVTYCTKYEQNQPLIFLDIATNIKFKKNIGIIAQIWQKDKLYFTFGQHMLPDYCTKYE